MEKKEKKKNTQAALRFNCRVGFDFVLLHLYTRNICELLVLPAKVSLEPCVTYL